MKSVFKYSNYQKLNIRVTLVNGPNLTYQNTNCRQPCTTWWPSLFITKWNLLSKL